MKFNGLQKMTLLDFPQKVACTLFTAGCNLRCPFCHNASLVTEIDNSTVYSTEQILNFLSTRQNLLDGVCITGGEPLMHSDIVDFASKVKKMGFALKVDTNGTYPELLKTLIDKNLVDYVAMDIKNCRERYSETVGVENLDLLPIEKSIALLMNGTIPYEFRTTVVKEFHTVEDIIKICKWIKGAQRYYLQNFVDSGNLIGENLSAVNKDTIYSMRDVAREYIDTVEIRGI